MDVHAITPDRLATIGGRMRSVRLAKGMTATEVAEKLGISRPALSTWENGIVARIPDDKIDVFAKITNVNANWLKHMTGEAPKLALDIPDRAFVGLHRERIDGRVRAHETASEPLPPDNIRALSPVEKPVPEIKASAPSFGDDHHDEARWHMPREVLKLAFNCDPDAVVMKRVRKAVTVEDGTPVQRGDYFLIDASRNTIDEPGMYYVADPQGKEAHRASASRNDAGEIIVKLDNSPSTMTPEDGWTVLGRVMAVFHAMP